MDFVRKAPQVANLPTYENKSEPNDRRPVLSYGEEIDPIMALRNCEIGKSFVVDREWDRKRMFNVARQLGFKIRTRKEVAGWETPKAAMRFRIWRKS